MNKLESTLPELANMLTNIEPNIKKEKGHVMVVDSSGARKKRLKKKAQKVKAAKPSTILHKDKAVKEKYHLCGKTGY